MSRSLALTTTSLALPAANSQTVTGRPGVENVDLSVFKQFHVSERKILEIRFQAFNAFNHFNPSRPTTANTTVAGVPAALLNLNYSNGANTNAAFGTVTSAALPARHGVISARFTF